jgi:UDP-arabinose 4-epimerase|tara:strand:+ start:654 stop:1637 length:984 start_codon:yes stop_codon:yes gene_type:complete
VNNNILVTGGAGYIGSHVCKHLALNGFNPIAFDNLSRGNRWSIKWGPIEVGDLLDPNRLKEVLEKYKPVAVMHFAAFAYVGESVDNPYLYYYNNVCGTLNLLNAMKDADITNIVFSSTCSTYGIPDRVPIQEIDPQNPINPYGASKLMIERILKDYNIAYHLNSISLRYFNAAGADPDGEIGEVHDPEPHLIPRLLDVAIGRRKNVEVYGDGHDTPDGFCIRDYIHVEDLATAHILALKYLLNNGVGVKNYNLGTGKGHSVLDVIKTVEKVARKKIDYKVVKKRDGDPPELVAGVSGALETLKWKPSKPALFEQVTSAWRWHNKYFR